jgi:hypothetical protein
MNNFAVNPKYKWAEIQLGTQYLNYSNLSTGDIGIFGAGFDLRPGKFELNFSMDCPNKELIFSVAAPMAVINGKTGWLN